MNEKAKIHAFYILLLLGLTIVALVTVKWGAIADLVGYISFAATVTSLALAALAIAYSIYANTSLAGSLAALSTSSQSIASASGTITDAARDLTQRVEQIPRSITEVSHQVEESHSLLMTLLEKRPPSTEPSLASTPAPPGFIDRTSIGGLLTLFLAYTAYTKSAGFDLKRFAEANTTTLGFDYSYGFLVASAAAGVLNFNNSQNIWTVTFFDADIGPKLRPALERSSANITDAEVRGMLVATIAQVGALFE